MGLIVSPPILRVIRGEGKTPAPMTEAEGILVDKMLEEYTAKHPDASKVALRLVLERALGIFRAPAALRVVDGGRKHESAEMAVPPWAELLQAQDVVDHAADHVTVHFDPPL